MVKHNPKVGFVFSTKDRVDYTLRSLKSIDTDSGFDLIWVDGSDTSAGGALPQSVNTHNCKIREVIYDVKGGPDNAIRFGLRRLLDLGYDYCGLIENDIEFRPGWYNKLMELFELGEKDDLRVGVATVRTINSRVLIYQAKYVILWNAGAGMALFTREAAQTILAAYPPPTSSKSVNKFYVNMFGLDLRGVWELWMDQPSRCLGCDWSFSMHLYKLGFCSLGSIPSMAFNIDFKPEEALRSSWVNEYVQVSKMDNQRFVKLKIAMSQNEKGSTVKRSFLLAIDYVKCAMWRLERYNKYFRYIRRSIRSAKSLDAKIRRVYWLSLIKFKFLTIRRGRRDRCWCGGELMSFKLHPSYGVCVECGCYVNRHPAINLQKLYSSNFYWHIMQKYYGYPPIELRSELYKGDGRLAYWLQLIQRYGPAQGKVIEVGCAPGILLAELQAKGYQCIGVEPDKRIAGWMEQNMKVNIRTGFFPDIALPNCDLFLAFDVLEHCADPHQFMRKVSQLLNSQGIAIIQTPIERYGYNPPFGESFKDAFKEYEHFFLFTPKAINIMAERAGLNIISSEERLWLHHEICIFKKS